MPLGGNKWRPVGDFLFVSYSDGAIATDKSIRIGAESAASGPRVQNRPTFDQLDRENAVASIASVESSSIDALAYVFRTLICIDAGTAVLGLFLAFYFQLTVPQENDESPLALAFSCSLLLVFAAAIIAAWIGMWHFKNWSRWLYLWLGVFIHAVNVLTSVFRVESTWELIHVNSINATIAGAIITLSLLPPVALRFKRV